MAHGNLAHTLGPVQLFSLAFGAILGAGWIIALGSWIGQAGPVGTAIGFVAGAVIISVIALCYAEIGARFPATGGEVVYAHRTFGSTAAYFTGWFLALTYVAVGAFEAISLGWISEALLPGTQGPVLYRLFGENVHVTGLVVGLLAVGATTILNIYGVKATSKAQDLLTAVLVAASLVFIAVGLWGGHVSLLQPWFATDIAGRRWPGVVAVFVTAPFWFSGFGVVSQALGEGATPARRIQLAWVLLLAINASCLFYVLVVLVASAVVPRAELLGLALPAAGAFRIAFQSPLLAKIVLFTGLLGLLVALNAIFYSATRVLYALAAQGLIPKFISQIHPRHESPTVAVTLVGLVIALGTALGRGAIGPLVDATAIVISGIYLMVCLATLRERLRSRVTDPARRVGADLLLPSIASLLTALLLVIAVATPIRDAHGSIPLELRLLLAAVGLGIFVRLRCRQPAIT